MIQWKSYGTQVSRWDSLWTISADLTDIIVSYPPICFFSLAQSSRSVKRKTCRSFLAPSTNSTMKLSLRSWRFCRKQQKRMVGVGDTKLLVSVTQLLAIRIWERHTYELSRGVVDLTPSSKMSSCLDHQWEQLRSSIQTKWSPKIVEGYTFNGSGSSNDLVNMNLSYSSINLQFTGHRGMNDVTVAQERVLFGALGIVTDVRLCNEMRNAAICQKGAVMPLYKWDNRFTRMEWNKNGKQTNIKPQLNSNSSLLCAHNLGIASM